MTTPCLLDDLPAIAGRLDRAAALLLGLDYDGTLTPIRPRPEQAVLDDAIRALLARLHRCRQAAVMIVSGRSLADVRERVGLPGLFYAGNHGLEIAGPGLSYLNPEAAAALPRIAALTQRVAEAIVRFPAAQVEAKELTTSIHYRNVAPELWEDLGHVIREVVAQAGPGIVLTTGHGVWEIRPEVAWHKGAALRWTLRHLPRPADRLPFFLGDDRTDEDGFASLPDGVTVRVGPPVATQARYRLPDPAAVATFLEWLAGQLEARS